MNAEFPRFNSVYIAIRFEYFLGVTEFYPSPGYLSGSNTKNRLSFEVLVGKDEATKRQVHGCFNKS